VKKRPANTVSERQLVWALQGSGRQAGLRDLVAWRKIGLLPHLASQGIGAGRSYYWREAEIVKQAEAVYDALNRYGRPDAALIAVWLGGFTVPLVRVRRAWLGRSRVRRSLATSGPLSNLAPPSSRTPTGLLEQAFGALAALTATDPTCRHMAQEVLDHRDGFQSRSELKRHLTGLALVYGPLLENTDLIRAGSDEEFFEARRNLRKIFDSEEQPARGSEILEFLFLFSLALVHSGQRHVLDAVDAMTKKDGNPKDSDRLRIAS
jgi:hypothetical protein